MNRAQFYQGLVAELIAGRIARERSQALTDADERWADNFWTPAEEARRNMLFATLEGFTKIPTDEEERSMPIGVDCARITDGEIREETFRRMLRNWTAPESAEFRRAVLADLDITVTFGKWN